MVNPSQRFLQSKGKKEAAHLVSNNAHSGLLEALLEETLVSCKTHDLAGVVAGEDSLVCENGFGPAGGL